MVTDSSSYQNRCPHRLITASLAVSRHILHSKVLSWLPLSAAVELLDPGLVFSVAAVEPEAGGGAAVAIKKNTDPLKKTRYRWRNHIKSI